MLPNATLTIFNASAGTGKTFTLTREYVRLCLESDNPYRFRDILALTFTNKAAAEMRTRILQKLRELAVGSERDISSDLMQSLNIQPEELQQRARNVVSAIIHDMASVSISTIDRFTYRLLRTFSFELNINTGARLRMDADAIARQTVDNLLEMAAEPGNKLLNRYLTNYVHDQMKNDKSWFVVTQLQSMVKRLHHENDREAVHQLSEHDLDEFNRARSALTKEKKDVDKKLATAAQNLEKAFEAVAAHHADMSYIKDLTGLFKKNHYVLPSPRPLKNRENAFLRARSKASPADMQPLTDAFDELVAIYSKWLPTYNILKEIEKHFDAVALMGELQTAYNQLRDEENFINIGEFQTLVQELTGSDTPDYMFERLGDRYQWFFIDEFQDTSNLQWNNLKTLAQHAMANNGGSMLVGDPKQSIYRWRGSNPELFINIYNDNDPERFSILPDNKKIACYGLNNQTLDTNYRSGKAIVDFVYDLFIHRGESSTPAEIAYSEVTQKAHKHYSGYLELAFFQKKYSDDKEDVLRERTLKYIEEALNDGYELRDICILTRSNKDGKKVAQWINECRNDYTPALNVISNESFILDNQSSIRCVVAAVGYALFPHLKGYRFDLLQAFYEMGTFDWHTEDVHPQIDHYVQLDQASFETAIQRTFPAFSTDALRSLPLVETCIRLMQMFHLHYGEDVYLQAFIQAVRTRAQDSPIDKHEFLQWWADSQREIISIDVPENLNAINITTVHKAKGLEWPVVIMPYTDWAFHAKQSTMWIDDDTRSPLGKTQVDVKEEKERIPYPDVYNKHVEAKRSEDQFDNINMLYVAFTRAAQRLYALSFEPRSANNTVYSYLTNKLDVAFSDHYYELSRGEKHPKIEEKANSGMTEHHIRHIDTGGAAPILRVGRKYSPGINDLPAIARGNTIHDALQSIALDPDKIDPTLDVMTRSQRITEYERTDIRNAIETVIAHPFCAHIRANATDIRAEQTILLPGGDILRPDLIAITPNGQTYVIDYKTGDPMPQHKQQLDRYINVLEEMGHKSVKGELIYV